MKKCLKICKTYFQSGVSGKHLTSLFFVFLLYFLMFQLFFQSGVSGKHLTSLFFVFLLYFLMFLLFFNTFTIIRIPLHVHIQTSTYTYKYSLTHLNNHLHIKTVTYFYIFLSEVRPGILERRGWILPKNLCNYPCFATPNAPRNRKCLILPHQTHRSN